MVAGLLPAVPGGDETAPAPAGVEGGQPAGMMTDNRYRSSRGSRDKRRRRVSRLPPRACLGIDRPSPGTRAPVSPRTATAGAARQHLGRGAPPPPAGDYTLPAGRKV